MQRIAAVIALLGSTVATGQDMASEELFDGTLAGWTIENTAHDNFRVIDGVLRVEAPEGWLRSARRYGDFELRVEFRFLTEDADSGIFFRAVGNESFSRGWPNSSYQVQMRNPLGESRFAPVGGLFRHGMPEGETDYDEGLARRVSRPTGEWQVIVVRVTGGEVVAELNGETVLRAGNIANPEGHIGLQGETGALEYRSLRITAL